MESVSTKFPSDPMLGVRNSGIGIPVADGDPYRRTEEEKPEGDEVMPAKFRRLGVLLILIFFYLYIADSDNKSSSEISSKTNVIVQESKNTREKRSVMSMNNVPMPQATVAENFVYDSEDDNCNLTVDRSSADRFQYLVSEQNGKKMIYFRFNFNETITVTKEPQLYLPYRWVWTTKGIDHSTYKMLEYPFDFGLLSLGLLSRYVYRPQIGTKHEFVVNMGTNNSCKLSLHLGTNNTILKIRDALRGLFPPSVEKHYIYHSLFCYESVISKLRSPFWWNITHMLAVPKEYTYYTCWTAGHSTWHKEYHKTYYIWWILAWSIAVAAFSPLFLHIIPDHKRTRNSDSRWELIDSDTLEGSSNAFDVGREPPDFNQEKMIYLGQNPTSVIPMVKKLLCLHKSNSSIRRLWRVVIVLLSLCILMVKTLVYYYKEWDDVTERLRLDVPVGELCLPYGFAKCLKNSGYLFGGPTVYIPVFVIIASVLLCIPESIPDVFLSTKEFQDDPNVHIYTFMYLTDGVLESRGIIRRQFVMSGYACLAGKIRERFFMILSFTFWRSFFRMWRCRLKRVNPIRVAYYECGQTRCFRITAVIAAFLPTVIVWTLLIGTCLVEFCLVLVYYGLPIILFVKLAISGLMNLVLNGLSLTAEQGGRYPHLRLILIGIISVVVLVATLFVTTVAMLNFLHTFWFLVNIITFTFAGLVIYPEYSATYSIAAIAILYYIFKSVSGFTEGYIRLLQKVVHVSDRLQRGGWRPYGYPAEEDEYRPCYVHKRRDSCMLGVPRAAYDYVARMVHPVRVQVSVSILKLIITANIIYSTVNLTQAFRVGNNISLTTRIIAVIFVGIMPEVFGVFSSKVRRMVDEETFEKRVERCVKNYWQEHLKLAGYEAMP